MRSQDTSELSDARPSLGARTRAATRRWWDEAVRPRLVLARLLPRGGCGLVALLLAVNLALGLLPVAFVLMTSRLIGTVPEAVAGRSGAMNEMMWLFVLAAAIFLGNQVVNPVQDALAQRMRRRVDSSLRDEAMAVMLGPVGIGPLEDREALDHLSEVTRTFDRNWGTPGLGCAGTLALVARYTRLVTLCLLIGTHVAWTASLAVAAATMGLRYAQRGGLRKYYRAAYDVVGLHREADYLRDTAMSRSGAKEVLLFGLTDLLTARFEDAAVRAMRPVSAARRKAYLTPYLVTTAVALVLGGAAFVVTVQRAAGGDIHLEAFAIGMQSIVSAMMLGVYFPEADTHIQYASRSLTALESLRHRISRLERATGTATASAGADAGRAPVPTGTPTTSLRLERVTFRYPSSCSDVFQGLDLEIPVGRSTAIVGVNGAGKTTLVKLLTRLYEPTSGAVTTDGVDIREFDAEAWRRQVSVVFQDFLRLELTAAENIAAGAPHVPAEPAAILRAARHAGIAETLLDLPLGLATPLSRAVPHGVDLSGGQWQRVAIARALFAVDAGARLLVLDEPTATLDVRAEKAFFDQFVDLTRGVTSVLISHRFSTVRRADNIVVLNDGVVTEQGSHEELVAVGGRYATLFAMQAEQFDGRKDSR